MATSKAITPTAQEVIQHIPFDRIDESPFNPRKTFDEKRLNELAKSISATGVAQPLVARDGKKGRLELVFGARRLRAAIRAQANPPIWLGKTVPVIVRSYTDEQVKDIQLTENLQRDDLHPMEEAEAYEDILKHPDYTIQKLAARLGVETKYITKRLEFLKLIAAVRKLFVSCEIGWEQALQFCRMTPEVQAALLKHFDDGKDIPKATQIASIIEKNVFLDLSNAPFDITNPNLVPKAGACPNCPKRTGFNKELFDDVKKGDYCLDRPCFASKVDALLQIKLKPQPAPDAPKGAPKPVPPVPISTQRYMLTAKEKDELPKGTLTPADDFKIITKKDECEFAEAAVIVHGDNLGKDAIICRAKECKEHSDRHQTGFRGHADDEKARVARLKKERAEKQAKETRRAVLVATGEKAAEIGRPELQQACRAIFTRLYNELQRKMLNVLGYMRDRKKTETWDDLFEEGFSQLKGEGLHRVLVMLSLATFIDGVPYGKDGDTLMEFAKRYRVNVDKVTEEVAAKYDKSKTAAKGASTPAKAEKETKKKAAAAK